MSVDFDRYRYYPSLRSRLWEMRGYCELSDEDKDRLLPIIPLASHQRTKAIGDVAAKVAEYLGDRPRILDLEQSSVYGCEECRAMLDPTNGFLAWRSFVAAQPNSVPSAVLPSDAPIREIVQQVRHLERDCGQVVIRSRMPSTDLHALQAALSAVDEVDNLMVVLDFGYVLSRPTAIATEAANVINALRATDDAARVVVMASSYPKSAAAYDDAGTSIPIQERSIHAALGGDAVAIYGDYGSIHPEPMEPLMARFVPRIDYPLPDAWVFRRVRADQGGFQQCAKLITGLTDWQPDLVGKVWGASKISAAADGDLVQMGTPGPWIAVRVNLHLWQQIHYGDGAVAVDDFDVFA
jgi:hypothetical protein